jgi:hypothetical protein
MPSRLVYNRADPTALDEYRHDSHVNMRLTALCLGLLVFAGTHCGAAESDAYSSWDTRCEECHGDAREFARKYLWVVDGQLQGRHHIDDLHLFMENHYIPSHEVDKMREMLQGNANELARFAQRCGSCHDGADDFVRRSISTWGGAISGVNSGIPVAEFLLTHEGLGPEEAEFFTRLIVRVESQLSY